MQSRQHSQRRCLSRAIGSEQSDDFAFIDGEAEVANRGNGSVANLNVLDTE